MQRSGFTLLEVLVALGLSLVLLSAVFASLSLYWKYSTAGKDEIERLQIARALLRQIETDLRSVVFQAATSSTPSASSSSSSSSSSNGGTAGSGSSGSSSSTGGTSSGGSSSSSTTASTTTPDSALTTTSSGLFGNANTIMMHVSRPSRTETYAAFADNRATGGRMSDLQSVAYFVGGQGGGALAGAVASPGLARMAGDRLLMQTADQQGNAALMAANTQVLAPEVQSIAFYYFDGTTWLSAWDSVSLNGLPKAVEIVLELAPSPGAAAKPRPTTVAATAEETSVYRLVVVLPAGKPTITTAQ
jgi:prepilin-type N-terminal cleavage/methylation domain-containing protein